METSWKSVAKDGNPVTDGEYLVTAITESGKYDTKIGEWQRGYWNFDTSIVIAYAAKPKPYQWSLFKRELEGISIAFSTVSLVSVAPDMASTYRDCSSQTASAICFACAM